jgi:hypothetical protein
MRSPGDSESGPAGATPSRLLLVALLLLALTPPLVSQATGSVVGSFTMFSRLEGYHLALRVVAPSGARPVRVASLAPHLSSEARYMLLPAQGHAVGADQVDVVEFGLRDLGRLLCQLNSDATSACVKLEREQLDTGRIIPREECVPCSPR